MIFRLNAMTHSRRQGINLILRGLELTPKLLNHYIFGLFKGMKDRWENKVMKRASDAHDNARENTSKYNIM